MPPEHTPYRSCFRLRLQLETHGSTVAFLPSALDAANCYAVRNSKLETRNSKLTDGMYKNLSAHLQV